MKKLSLSLVVCVLFLSKQSLASASASFNAGGLTIEPIIGYQTVYRDTPTPHTSTEQMVGGRVAIGSDALAGELQYTKGSDTESYSTAPQQVKTDDEKLQLGLRSNFHFNEYLFLTLRAGGQGSRSNVETTTNGLATSTTNPIAYAPYAGASLGVHLGSYLSLSAGSTVVFKDSQDMSKNEIQNTLSLSIGVNK